MFPAKKNTTRAEKTGIWRILTGITNLALEHGGIKRTVFFMFLVYIGTVIFGLGLA
jgi:hypothetical protein